DGDGIRDGLVTGVQSCVLPIYVPAGGLPPAPPAQAWHAIGRRTAGWNVGRSGPLDTSGRLRTSRYWPFAYAAWPVTSPPASGTIRVGPFALASVAPLPFSHRSRYTASASPPMRKYGRSAPSATFWGNWSETTSGEAFFAASAPDCVGSSQVTWKATSLSFRAARRATIPRRGSR